MLRTVSHGMPSVSACAHTTPHSGVQVSEISPNATFSDYHLRTSGNASNACMRGRAAEASADSDERVHMGVYLDVAAERRAALRLAIAALVQHEGLGARAERACAV